MDRAKTPALILALLVGANAIGVHAREEPAPGFRVETDVQEHFYDVRGRTADEVFASIHRQGLGGTPGRAASGLTKSELSYTVRTSTTLDTCRITDLTLRADVVVTLPRHVGIGSLDPSTRTLWEAYEAQVEFHEYRHVEIEFQGLQELESRLRREVVDVESPLGRCTVLLDRAIAEQTETTRRRHEEFHVEESRAVREAQAELVAEIEALDADLGRSRVEVERRTALLGALAAERETSARTLEALFQRWGDPLPEPMSARAADLASAVGRLDDEIRLVSGERTALVDRYDERVNERRNLVGRLAWTR